MPQLLVFAPCEKVIVSQEDNNPTLIAILTELGGTVELEKGANPGEAKILPFRWSVFTMWRSEPEDSEKHFEQIVRLLSPSGAMALEHIAPFRLLKATHRLNLNLMVLPIAEAGIWNIELRFREVGAEMPSVATAVYPLKVHFDIQESK
jgi:hypothetical protein